MDKTLFEQIKDYTAWLFIFFILIKIFGCVFESIEGGFIGLVASVLLTIGIVKMSIWSHKRVNKDII